MTSRFATRTVMCRNCANDFDYESGGGKDRPLCPACEATYKWCPTCGFALVHAAFNTDRACRGGIEGQCRQCKNARTRKKHERNPSAARAHKLRSRYGIGPDEWDRMLLAQTGRCAICEGTPRDFHVDHCHQSGTVRGLLCAPCNKGLGHFQDDIDRMISAVAYLMGGD